MDFISLEITRVIFQCLKIGLVIENMIDCIILIHNCGVVRKNLNNGKKLPKNSQKKWLVNESSLKSNQFCQEASVLDWFMYLRW